MKKTICLASALMLFALCPQRSFAQDDSTDDNVSKISQDSLDRMSPEEYYAYFDSIYRAQLPKLQIVELPDTAKVVIPSERQKENFSYSNSYVPNSVSISTTNAVGQIEIQSDVSPTGAKTYSVPIKAYQFDGVFCPSISLTYNSQAGSSSCGKGWSIGGLQSIVRGSKSIYYDGKTEGMKMNANDVFYLNGIRLVHISGNEYETEQGKIKAVANVSGTVVKYFNVYYPNGYTAVFGMTNTTTNKLEYPITTLTDERGRNINYSYISYSNTYNISSITYDNNNARISFTYDQTRADYVQGYRGGLLLDSKYLLKTIACTRNSSEIGTYTLTYITDANTSLLEKIDFSANGSSLNPLKFYYGDDSALQEYISMPATVSYGYEYDSRSGVNAVRGRFDYLNGNDGLVVYPNMTPYFRWSAGISSLNYFSNTYNANELFCIYAELDPDVSGNQVVTGTLGNDFITILSAALIGNQQENIIKVNNGVSGNNDALTFSVYVKDAMGMHLGYTRTFNYSTVHTDGSGHKSIQPKFFYTGDFNGDGKMEVMAVSANNPFGDGNYPSTCYIYDLKNNTTLYTNNSLLQYQVSFIGNQQMDGQVAENNSDKLFTVDYNGDGKTDLCHINPSGMDIYEFNQNGSTWSAQLVATYSGLTRSGLANRSISLGDYNGDGLTDFIVSSPKNSSGGTTWTFHFSKGDGSYLTATSEGPNTLNTTSDFLSQDIDGDGITDLVELAYHNYKGYMVKNNTLTLGASQLLAHTNSILVPVSMYSTSLSTQFVSLYGCNARLYSYKTNQRVDQALTGMANSYGVVEKNYYYPISNNDYDIYFTSNNATFPYCNVFEGIPVVAGSEVFTNSGANNHYLYYNAVVHRQGLGFRGFEQVKTINKRNQLSTTTYEPYKYSVLKKVDTPTATITYTNEVTPDSYKRLTPLVTSKTEYDKLKDITGTTTYTYNNLGQVLTENTTLPGSISVNKTYTYTNFENINSKYRLGRLASATTTTSRGSSQHSKQTSITSYNTNDQPLTIINKVNGNKVETTTMVYDSNGNMTSKSIKPYTSQTARTFTYEYTTGNRMTKETPPVGPWKSYSYNTDGTVSSVGSNIGTTTFTYDAFGRVISESRPDTTVINWAFVWTTSYGGRYAINKSGSNIPSATTVYDALDREVRSMEARFNGNILKVAKSYDTYGDLVQESYPFKGGTPVYKQYTYDDYHRLIGKSEDGRTTSLDYDGTSTTVSDGTMSTTSTVDALGGLISVEDAAGEVSYTLNGAGNPTFISAPGDITTTIGYDGYGRRTSIADPSHGTTTYVYHSTEGYLQSETNASNQTTTYVCDIYGRTTRKTTPEFYTDYTYNNSLNKMTAETSSNGTSTTYSYDALGRLSSTRENAVDNKWLQRDYTYSKDKVSSIKYTSQNGVLTTERYAYTNGYLTAVTLSDNTQIFQLNGEHDNGLTHSISSMGMTRTYGYTVSGLPTSRTVTSGSQTYQTQTYNFNAATGNLTSRYYGEVGHTENFAYDYLHRLTSYDGTAVTYDDNGNIASKGDVGTFAYNTTGKPYAVSEVTLNNPISVEQRVVSYYSFDRPSMVTYKALTATFTYNGNYDRVRMQTIKNNQVAFSRYYLGGCYELDVLSSGSTEKLYLMGGYYDAPVALVKKNGSTSYSSIFRDYLGSITKVITNGSSRTFAYDAWGRMRNISLNSLFIPENESAPSLGRGFCGHEHLTGFGLINMNARLYDPMLGRFLSPDPKISMPYMSQAYNRYSYGLNNPLSVIDRDGETPVLAFVIGAIVGGYLGGVAANSGSKQMWNPLKWDYSSVWTYLGILGGGCLGGYAGSALAAGNMGVTASLMTPFGAIALNYDKDKNGNPTTDWEINTPMGGHWNSGEEKGIENADKSIDDTVNSMRDRYRQGVEHVLNTNSYLNNMYYGIRYGTNVGEASLKSLKKYSSHPDFLNSSIKQIRFFNYGYQFEELYRDYIIDGGFGYNFWNDFRIDFGSWLGGYTGGTIGSLAGPVGTFSGAIFGSFYLEMYMRNKIMEEYLHSIQPTNNGWDGYYDFMTIY